MNATLRQSMSHCLATGAIGLALLTSTAPAQVSIQTGLTLEPVTSGLRVPLQMQFDSQGRLFVGSGYLGDEKVPLVCITPDGQVQELPSPVLDPDCLAVGPDDLVYTGASKGRVFVTDPDTGDVSIWVKDEAMANLDGLRWHDGDLYAVAIFGSRVWRIDGETKEVSMFADFASIGITGMTGIAFHPTEPRVFFGSPWENVIVETDLEGQLVNPEVAAGFTFVGHLDFDPTGAHPDQLFIADNGAGDVWVHDLATGLRQQRAAGFLPYTGCLVFNASGDLYISATDNDGHVGQMWRQRTMEFRMEGTFGDRQEPAELALTSPGDANCVALLFASFDDRGIRLGDGRHVPLGLHTLMFLGELSLDGGGEARFALEGAHGDPLLHGVSAHFACATLDPNAPEQLRGITDAVTVDFPE